MSFVWTVLLVVFGLSWVVQLLFWGYWVRPLITDSAEPHDTEVPSEQPVSIVVCAKNEAQNLQRHLPLWLGQVSDTAFEVVLVDDHSTDDTLAVAHAFAAVHPHLRVLSLTDAESAAYPGKKMALTRGIAAARYDLLLLTDADCYPASNQWLQSMRARATEHKAIVLGIAPLIGPSGLAGRFMEYEAIYTAIQYTTFALRGDPYMGVGRNMMYRKSLFDRVQGYSSHTDIASGDDDLFIRDTADTSNTAVQLSQKSFVYSAAPSTISSYLQQKRRHLSTSVVYKPRHILALGLLSFSHLHIFLYGIILLFSPLWTYIVIAISIRTGVYGVRMAQILTKLRHRHLLPHVLLLDVGMLIYYTIGTLYLVSTKRNKW